MRAVFVLAACLLQLACTDQRPAPPAASGAVTPAVPKQAATDRSAATPEAAVAGSSTATAAAPALPADDVLTCGWPGFARSTSVEQLRRVFGPANVETADEGEGITAVSVHPRDPRREVRLQLFDATQLQGASVNTAESAWKLPGGVGMGAGLADVERANGQPFELHVHAGGASSKDWNGGALGSGGCVFFANFTHAHAKIATPYTIRSDDPAIRALGLKVDRFGLSCSGC